MKDLVASIVAGITIMIDRPFQLGDRVQLMREVPFSRGLRVFTLRVRNPDNKVAGQ